MLAPSRANMAGALQGPVQCCPVRQVIAPRPKLPPIPMANFLTEGITITHSALSSRSFGRLSGMFRISLRTAPHSCRRFCSLLSSAPKAGRARTVAISSVAPFPISNLPDYLQGVLAQDTARERGEEHFVKKAGLK